MMKDKPVKRPIASATRRYLILNPRHIFAFLVTFLVQFSSVYSQDILFDFDSAPIHTSLPIVQSVGGVTAYLSATGSGYSIQEANVLGFTPQGFSGLSIYPNSVFLADLLIRFNPPITDFSILYACQELGCDDAATMRVTAYRNAVYVGTNTRTATYPGTWPTDTLRCSFPEGFDSVVIHYAQRPPTCQDYGVIYMADNMRVTPLAGNTVPVPITPSNYSVCLQPDSPFGWDPVATASSYRLQVSYDSGFALIAIDSSAIASTTCLLPGLLYNTLYYWRVNANLGGPSSDWSTIMRFSTAPAPSIPPFLYTPADGASHVSTDTVFKWHPLCTADSYRLQISPDTGFGTLFLEQTGIVDTVYHVTGLSSNTTYYWRVKCSHGLTESDWSTVWTLTTSSLYSSTFMVRRLWNLVSVPVIVQDSSIGNLFASAISPAYSYSTSAGYQITDKLAHGCGYWLKFNSAVSIQHTGTALLLDTVFVNEGWNLIGSLSVSFPVSFIGSIEPGLISSNLFEYSANGYSVADTVRPGSGYWVKVNRNGALILSSSGIPSTMQNVTMLPTVEMPPPPPQGQPSIQSNQITAQARLEQNYPNPFNPSTVIRYRLNVDCYVTLKVLDVLGREIATLVDGMQNAGYKTVVFEASNIPNGVYIYKIQAGALSEVKKMVVMK